MDEAKQSEETRETALLEGFYPEEQRHSPGIEMTDRSGCKDKWDERKEGGELDAAEQEILLLPENISVVSLLELKRLLQKRFFLCKSSERGAGNFLLRSKIFTIFSLKVGDFFCRQALI